MVEVWVLTLIYKQTGTKPGGKVVDSVHLNSDSMMIRIGAAMRDPDVKKYTFCKKEVQDLTK